MCACLAAVSSMAEQADSIKVKNESHSLNLYGFARAEMYVNSRENTKNELNKKYFLFNSFYSTHFIRLGSMLRM